MGIWKDWKKSRQEMKMKSLQAELKYYKTKVTQTESDIADLKKEMDV